MRKLFITTMCFCCTLLATATNLSMFVNENGHEEYIYGRKDGMSLSMVRKPAPVDKDIHRAVIWCMSANFHSSHDWEQNGFADSRQLTDAGYTVFFVFHGSEPRYSCDEAFADIQRAIRYIRANADTFGIDPDNIGITGTSAAGCLSVLSGTNGKPGNADAKDYVDRASSRIQAVVCWFPVVDFVNLYPVAGEEVYGQMNNHHGCVDFKYFNTDKERLDRITDAGKIMEIRREMSAIENISEHTAPTLIFHGTADELIPHQHSIDYVAALKKAGIPAELILHSGGHHGWDGMWNGWTRGVEWFDKYLKVKR